MKHSQIKSILPDVIELYIDVWTNKVSLHEDDVLIDKLSAELGIKPTQTLRKKVKEYIIENYLIVESCADLVTHDGTYVDSKLAPETIMSLRRLNEKGWLTSAGYRHSVNQNESHLHGDRLLLIRKDAEHKDLPNNLIFKWEVFS